MVAQREAGLMVPLSRQTKTQLMATLRRRWSQLGLTDEQIEALSEMEPDRILDALRRYLLGTPEPASSTPAPTPEPPAAPESTPEPHPDRTPLRTHEHPDPHGEAVASEPAPVPPAPPPEPVPSAPSYEEMTDAERQAVRAALAAHAGRQEQARPYASPSPSDWLRRFPP
jgi:hypothetical protein